ncbi:MAG: capsule assembly Wzi family protein [Melioribacteraceae bacterium]|nr:capsule assembly Wzi family protein [Melioribacteraceae bacterium]
MFISNLKYSFSLKSILLFIFIALSTNNSQTVFEPIYRDIYPFLSKLSSKGIIELNDEILPLSRKYILEKIIEVEQVSKNNPKIVTNIESEELAFWKKEYGLELQLSNKEIDEDGTARIFEYDPYDRFRAFYYSSEFLKLNSDPIFGIRKGVLDNKSYTHWWNGIKIQGYLSDWLGFSFDFRDNHESLDAVKLKSFSSNSGVTGKYKFGSTVDYSEIHTTLGISWDWGSFSVGKDFINWGYGESGKLVLSSKAPSFPFIRLDVYPTNWLRFNYIHAWLHSDVIDSTEIYSSFRNGYNRIQYRQKYLASHTLTLYPYDGLSISLGESIVYSDRLEISYLMPLMFFRLADHYLSNTNNNAGDNSQFFGMISSRNHIPNTHLYGTLFIDEIAVSDLFDAERERNQFGFTLGGSVVDLPVDDLQLTVEFTKIYPFVYRHYIPTQTYENQGYVLGHWMGHNSDLIYGSIKYWFMRGLRAELWGQYIRKGGDGIVDQQYTRPSQPFLFGLRKNHSYFGFNIKYEFMHDIFAEANYLYRTISEEQVSGSFTDKSITELTLAVYYGM